MQKLGIKAFDHFLRNELRVEVLEKYWDFNILSEADLQSVVWQLICSFLSRFDTDGRRFKVLNRPYLKELGIHPDVVVFRKRKPWVVIELKEGKRLKVNTALRERDRLLRIRKAFRAKKGYLVYVTRWGEGKVIRGPKGPGAKFFFEVPVVLESVRSVKSIKKWESDFKLWSRYVSDGK